MKIKPHLTLKLLNVSSKLDIKNYFMDRSFRGVSWFAKLSS